MRILLTGASGFIGTNLSQHLRKSDDLEVTNEDPDVIVHLSAAHRHVDDAQMFNANVAQTMELLHFAIKAKKRLVIAGSSHNRGIFGATKKICEEAVKALSPHYVDATYIRLPHVFGPHCKPNHNSFVTTLMDSIARGSEYKSKINDVQEQLELMHVDDVCKVFERAIRTSAADLIEQEANRGMKHLPPAYRVWHDGQFRMSIKDFVLIAEGNSCNRYSDAINAKIRSTMQWYHDQAR